MRRLARPTEHISRFAVVCVLLFAASGAHADPGFINLITDTAAVFNEPTVSVPSYLVTHPDPVFGTQVTRITGDVGSTLGGSGTWGTVARHHHFDDQPWNSDGTLIALQNSSSPGMVLLDGQSYQVVGGDCPFTISDSRWHPTHPHERIAVYGTELMWYDVLDCVKTRTWSLPISVDYIGGPTGNVSADGRFVALADDKSRIVIVDMEPAAPFAPYPSQRIGPVTDVGDCGLTTGCKVNWVCVSPSGKYLVVSYASGTSRVYDIDPTTLAVTPRAMPATALNCGGNPADGFIYNADHGDLTRNPFDNDEDVLVGQERCSLIGTVVGDEPIGGVVMVRLRDGAVTPLTDPTNESFVQGVSARNTQRPGWAYVSYYPRDGKRFSDEIVAVKLDGSESVERYAHKHATFRDCYRCLPQPVPSPDGRRVLWASNWAADCSTCGDPGTISAYVLDARAPVEANRAPDGTIDLPAADLTIVAGDRVPFAGSGTDPDGDAVTYQWSFGGGAPDVAVEDPGPVEFDAPGVYAVSLTVTDSHGLADPTPATRTVTVNANRAPDGTIDSPSADVTIRDGESVTFAGSGTDPDGDAVTYQWSFGGGAPDQAIQNPGPVSFATPGVYLVTLTVTDSRGLADPTPATRTVTVNANRAPDGTIVSPAGDVTIREGDNVTFAGLGTDPDGDEVTYQWSFGGGAPDLTVRNPEAVTFATVGVYAVTLTVTDSRGLADPTPATRTITVNANRAPDGTIDSPSADVTIRDGESVTFAGSGTDPDGDAVTYQWSFGGGAPDQAVQNPGPVSFATPGVYLVALTVTDSRGLADPTPATRTVTVNANRAPDGTIDFPAADPTITAGGSVTFAGTGSDPDGDAVTYRWSFGGGAPDQTVEDPGAVQFVTPGTYTITLTVTDTRGLADPTPPTRVITVNPNRAPNGTIDSPTSNTSVTAGGSVTFAATGTDPDGDAVTFAWSFDGGAPDMTVEDPGAVQFNTPGVYTVRLTVTDAGGLSDPTPATRTITVKNRAPNGTIDQPAASVTIIAGSSVTFAGTGTDPDGDAVTYAWSFGGGAPDQTVEDPGPVTFATAGVYTVTLTVTDARGLADASPATRKVTVNADRAPNGTIDQPITSTTIIAGSTVTFAGTGTDPDGDALTYAWSFAGGAPDVNVEDPGAVTFATPGVYVVTLTVTDWRGLADPSPATRKITVNADRAPNGTIDQPSANTTITAGSSVTFAGTGTDADGDALTYQWSFGGGAPDVNVEDPGAVTFATPGVYVVTLTVTDWRGLADPTPPTRRVTVNGNQPPNGTIDSPAADVAIYTGGSVTFAGTGTDPDGDAVTYLWSFGGAAPDQTVEDPGPVTFAAAGVYVVTFTVTDAHGLADLTPAIRTVTVADNPPPDGTIDSPAADAAIRVGDSVTFAGTGSDSDGDALTYRWSFGGGAPDATVEDPGPVQFTTAGAYVVTFTVTDSRGLADPTPATRTITVNVNRPPTATIDYPRSNVTITEGQNVAFSGTGTDPDGDAVTYLWSFDGAAPDQTVEDPGVIAFSTAGVYHVTLTVTDSYGLADPTPATRTVTVNPAGPVGAAHEVHWTFTGQTSVTVNWREGSDQIHYGLTSSYTDSVTAQEPSPLPFTSAGPFREARITGLAENTLYHYAIGNGEDHTFRTPPVKGTSDFDVYVCADIGSSNNYSTITPQEQLIAGDLPRFCLFAGDLTYGGPHGLHSVEVHFEDVMAWSQDAAYMPAWGNAEWDHPGTDDLRNYKGRFDFPNPQTSPSSPAASCCGEDWYWFDYGNVRFIAFPEPFSGVWADWYPRAKVLMDLAEQDPGIKYIVTFGHRPAYSSGHHPGSPQLAGYMDDLGATHPKYVLDLCGHSHDYERTYPQSGVVHITNGNGGAALEEDGSVGTCPWYGGCPAPAYSAFRAFHHGALKLHFGPDHIEGWEICGPSGSGDDVTCTLGSPLDHFVIGTTADLAPIVAAPAKVDGVAGNSIDFRVTASDPNGDNVDSLTPDLTALPSGDATWTPDQGGSAGTFHWRPSANDVGDFIVTFTARNALISTATTVLAVRAFAPTSNLVGNASFEASTAGWAAYGGSTLARVTPGFSGDWCAEVTGAATTTTRFGITDSPNWIVSTGLAGDTYHFSAWVRSTAATGKARLRAREYVGTALQGVEDFSTLTNLTPDWQRLDVDHVTITPGSTIDFHVLYDPTAPGQSFQVDSVTCRIVPPSAAKTAALPAPATDLAAGPLRFVASVRPVPVADKAVMSFTLTRPGPVEITVFGVDGRRMATLVDQPFVAAGRHEITLDPHAVRLSPGVYLYRVRAAEGSLTGRFAVLR